MKRLLVCIVLTYGLAIVMLGTFAYINRNIPASETVPAVTRDIPQQRNQ